MYSQIRVGRSSESHPLRHISRFESAIDIHEIAFACPSLARDIVFDQEDASIPACFRTRYANDVPFPPSHPMRLRVRTSDREISGVQAMNADLQKMLRGLLHQHWATSRYKAHHRCPPDLSYPLVNVRAITN